MRYEVVALYKEVSFLASSVLETLPKNKLSGRRVPLLVVQFHLGGYGSGVIGFDELEKSRSG